MTDILDTLDVIKNLENIYDSDRAFSVLKDYERVVDELGLYVYDNWSSGELVEGPKIERHWVTCTFMWPRDNMPDPMGGKRLVDYDCKVSYKKCFIVKPREIKKPDDIRPGTKKGKLDKLPVWTVTIQMPKSLIVDIVGGTIEAEEREDAFATQAPLEAPGAMPVDDMAGGDPLAAGGDPLAAGGTL